MEEKNRKIVNIIDNKKSIRNVEIGENVKICDYVNLYECCIGAETKIGTFVEIQKKVSIGNNCKIQSHTFICEGVHIEDEVFIGHGVCFVNDMYPRAVNTDGSPKTDKDWVLVSTYVKKGASIGTGATILGGIEVGENSIIGAGSVVTKDVPSKAIVVGNPARIIKYIE